MSGRDKKFTQRQAQKELNRDIHQGLHDYGAEKRELDFNSKSLIDQKFMNFSEKYGSTCELFEPLALNREAFGRLYIITPESKTKISNSIFNLDSINGNGVVLEELALQGMIQLIALKNNVYLVTPNENKGIPNKYNHMNIRKLEILAKNEENDKNLQKPQGYKI